MGGGGFAVRIRSLLCWGVELGLLLWAASSHRCYAQPSDAANPQYASAVALQNRGAFKLAAEQWEEFVRQFKSDPRIARAYHNLGVCYYQEGNLEAALRSFKTVVDRHQKSETLAASELYVGATLYEMAKRGKPQLYETAAQTFRTFLAKHRQGEQRGDALYYLGECLNAQGKRPEAIQVFTEFVGKFRDHRLAPEALYSLGVAQQEASRPEAAGKTCDEFLARFAKHKLAPEVTLRRGEIDLTSGNLAQAAKRFAAAAASQEDPNLADYAALRQADVLLQMKQFGDAATVYASIPAKSPKSQYAGQAAVAAGKCFFLADNLAQARKLLSPLVESAGPTAPEAAHWLARTLLREKKPAEALAVVERALDRPAKEPFAAQLLMDRADAVAAIPERRKESIGLYAAVAAKHAQSPEAPQALYIAAFVALEQGDYAAASTHANRFLEAHRQHRLAPDVLYVAAESSLQLGKLAEAERLFGQLLDEHSDHPDAELWKVRRAVSLLAQKKWQETIAKLRPILGELRLPESKAEAHFLIGSSQLELKQYPAAIQSLEASLAAQPKWRRADETLLLLADAFRQSGDSKKAQATLRRLAREFPESRLLDAAAYRLGQSLAAEGDYPAAAAQYRRLLDRWPESPLVPLAWHEMGCAQLNQKDAAGAEAAFSTFLEKFAGHALASRARYGRGMARHQLGKLSEAVEDLRAVLAADPAGHQKADAQFLLGLCLAELRQYDPAVESFRGLLEEQPNYAGADKARYQLAWALKLAGREAEAKRAFEDLIARNAESPLAPEAQHHVGESLYQNKEHLAAAKAYYAAVQKAPEGTPLYEKSLHKLGWCYYHLGNYDNARKTFGIQLEKCPDGPLAADAAFMAAECLFKQDKFGEALGAYKKVKDLSSKEFQALKLLHAGQAAGQMKQWPEAVEWLSQSTRQSPDAPTAAEALYELGFAQQNLGKPQEAISLYERAIAKTDREVAARAQFMIGELQFAEKKYGDAVKSYFKVLYGYSFPRWQADAAYEAGRCFELLGQKTQAVKVYRELLEKFPQSDRVRQAKERLAELKVP